MFCLVQHLSTPAAVGSPKDALLGLWSKKLPKQGAVHLHYQEIMTGKRVLVGYDFASGAYYKAFSTYVGGRAVDGTRYSGRPVAGQVQQESSLGPEIRDATFDDFMPVTVSVAFLNNPKIIDSVRVSEAGYELSATTPRGLRYEEEMPPGFDVSPRTVIYRFDLDGRLISAENYLSSGETIVWNYDESPLAHLGIVHWASKNTRFLIDYRVDPVADPEHFSMFGVERLAVAAALIEDSQPLWFGKQIRQHHPNGEASRRAKGSGVQLTPQEAAQLDASPRQAPTSRASWYLVGAGVAVVVLGIWLKRRVG